MNAIRLLFSANYWKYIFSFQKVIKEALTAIGTMWLLIEVIAFFSTQAAAYLKSHWQILLIIGLIYVLRENWPKTSFLFKLKDRDISIQLSIGNLFDYGGDLVIPINTSFDTSFENDLISPKSTQGQFTIKFFSEPRFLDQDITSALSTEPAPSPLPAKAMGKKIRYEIGKVLKLKLSRWNKFVYLLASSDMNDEGTSFTTFDNILASLANLWEFIRNKGECDEINIPIIGSGRGRVLESRSTLVKAIVHSFISSTTAATRFCNKLNIVIHPSDFKKYKIDMKELCEFIRLKTIHS